MSGFVHLESHRPPVRPVEAVERAAIGRSPQAREAGAASSEVPDQAGRAAPSPQAQIAIDQIIRNAQSLIASVLGARSSEIRVSINPGRYGF